MQELKSFRGGACLAISQEGLQWLCKRKCTDEEITKRDASVRLWMTKNHMASGESELLSFYCLHDCGSSWTNKGPAHSTVCPLPTLDSCRNEYVFTALPSINSIFLERRPWTDFLHTPDNVNYLTKNLNSNPKERVVIHYNDNILAKLISDAIYCRDVWSVEITGPFLNTNIEDPNRREISRNKNNPDQSQSDGLNKDCSDSRIWEGKMEKRSGIRRKSVSFADDVIVYLYDKDSPADKLSSDNHTSPPSNLSEVLFDDNGLEWEDDFLALEKNCHPHNHPESCPLTFSLPTQNWIIPKPKSLFLSQRCLFLTHVNESDLEP